ncbi:MAG: DPP IV N-terminal domain-containing protein, partial [Kordiimonas sp.]
MAYSRVQFIWASSLILLQSLFAGNCSYAFEAATVLQDYKRAERFMSWNATKYVRNGHLVHHWIAGDSDRFWYSRQTADGLEYILVDAENAVRQVAFDHKAVANVLSGATGVTVSEHSLTLKKYQLVDDVPVLDFDVGQSTWQCVLSTEVCNRVIGADIHKGELVSPDGQWALFLKNHNIWIRSVADNSVRQLTTDGVQHYAYGNMAGSSTAAIDLERLGIVPPPVAIWSPDSKRIITHRLDEREVLDLNLLQYAPESGSFRPKLYTYKYAMPGDDVLPTAEMYILNLDGTNRRVSLPALEVILFTPVMDDRVWWDETGQKIYIAPRELHQKRQQLFEVTAADGKVRLLISERANTYIDTAPAGFGPPAIRTLKSGEIIWYSERDGWGHLYLYDRDGSSLGQITKGTWQVRKIVDVNEDRREVLFTAGGREQGLDPYYEHLYRIGFDGTGLQRLTSEQAQHDVTVPTRSFVAKILPGGPRVAEATISPNGQFFIDKWSRPDLPSRFAVKKRDGQLVLWLEEADFSALEKGGFTMPEPFVAMASDGKTHLYGNIYKPSTFDPDIEYPIIDAIYPGPHSIRTPKTFMGSVFDSAQALAELGFIVVTVDGRGTPFRSKEFHDNSYGRMEQVGNLEDHMAVFQQLAERYTYIDLSAVGIVGHSGGGTAAARAILQYPDFYKVAISSAGAHDKSGYVVLMGTTYQGPYSKSAYAAMNNASLASNLKGKLLLAHGDLDDNVHPAHTMRLVHALVKANKDFD